MLIWEAALLNFHFHSFLKILYQILALLFATPQLPLSYIWREQFLLIVLLLDFLLHLSFPY